MGAFVEPPNAEFKRIAFRNASRHRMSDGLRSAWTISTICRPVCHAHCCRSRYGAGIAAEPGKDIPNISVNEFMVVAVPIVLQKPVEGADEATISMKPFWLISPDANSSRAFHTMVPEPTRWPLYQPFSIGPTDSAIAGIFTVAAAIKHAGTVLSQPMVRTTPSSG